MHKNRIMKSIKIEKKAEGEIRQSNRGDGFDQSVLLTCMEISQ
jgi:hypothetical protein